MLLVLLCFSLHLCAASLVAYCKLRKKSTKLKQPTRSDEDTKKTEDSNHLQVDKTQVYPPWNEEDDKKKGSKEERGNGNGEKGKEENKGKESKRSSEDYKDDKKINDKKNGDDKISREKDHKVDKKSSEEAKDKEKPHKVKTRKTEDDSWRKYRKSREAKTQCPEKSLSEEMESALRSAAELERKRKVEEKKQRSIEKTQYPEKSLMEEMNAALASELAASVANPKSFNGGELKLDHTAHTDASDRKK